MPRSSQSARARHRVAAERSRPIWPSTTPPGYHVEYGCAWMGYEILGGIGTKLAARSREAYVMIFANDPDHAWTTEPEVASR
jgi:hypothetical protein